MRLAATEARALTRTCRCATALARRLIGDQFRARALVRRWLGWTLGAGVEYALSNNWTARAEYRYTDFGTKTDTLALTYPGFHAKNHYTDQAVRLGLSYKFGGPSAVVAKY